jgi:Protein of unknown function (DUF2842)
MTALSQEKSMLHRRTRKLIGTFAMMVFVVVYALLVQAVAAPILHQANKIVEAMFYCVAGLAWAPPLMLLIRWMEGGRDDTRPTGPV